MLEKLATVFWAFGTIFEAMWEMLARDPEMTIACGIFVGIVLGSAILILGAFFRVLRFLGIII